MSRGQLQWASFNLTLLLEPHPVSAIIPDAPGQVRVHATLRVRNPGSDTAARVVFYLYRLLAVNSARLPHTEEPLRVRQRPQRAGFMEVNRVTLDLPRTLAPGGAIDVSMHYGGPLVGYREVMPYVHDSVQRQFALLRPESLWYPVPAGPRPEGLDTILGRASVPPPAHIAVEVPNGWLTVVPGAVPGGTARAFQVDAPPLGLIVVAGRFRRVAEGAVTLVYLPGYRTWAERALAVCRLTEDTLRDWLGDPLPWRRRGLSIVQVPRGWGSQNLGDVILQEGPQSSRQMLPALAHEVAHFWTPLDRDRFHEGLANYLQALIEEQVRPGQGFFASLVPRLPVLWDPAAMAEPLVGASAHAELDRVSRDKGALALAVLDTLLGRPVLLRVVRDWLHLPHAEEAGAEEFASYVTARLADHPKDVSRLVHDWFRGESLIPPPVSRLVPQAVRELAARYHA